MLEEALLLDAKGVPIRQDAHARSRDWDEVQDFCRRVYMPYRVRPLERFALPDSTMLSARVGRITMTRFSYGTGIHLDRFDPEAGNILVLNTLRGALLHQSGAQPATTRAGESFVVDCSRTDYWLEGDADHMQLNLTIPHGVMEEMALRWFGTVPDDALWTQRVKFAGPESRWLVLLDYVARSFAGAVPPAPGDAFARHMEEMLCLDLLREWASSAGFALERGASPAAPYYVRRAEEIMACEAREAPTIGEVAQRVGVSARTLSEGFRRFRGTSPRAFLAERRLEGVRKDIEAGAGGRSLAEIALDWGYHNFGALARYYRARFGELPTQTRARSRVKG